MKTRNSLSQRGLGVCTFEIQGAGSDVQLFPAGSFRARDGRPHETADRNWLLDDAIAAAVMAQLSTRQTDMVIDYEHQTLNAEINGKPAPAAGWIVPRDIEWRPGLGLFAKNVAWTDAAKASISGREYRYISPVFNYDRKTGAVLEVLHVALTNFPAIDGMEALVAAATARYLAEEAQPKENMMNREQLIALLGLSADASDEDINNALTGLKAHGDTASALAQEIAALKTEKATLESAVAAAKGASGQVDMSKFVPLEVVEDLKKDIAALRSESNTKTVEELVVGGLADGRLLPAQEKWARELGDKDIAALKGYLASTSPIAALKGVQHQSGPVVEHQFRPTKVSDLSQETLAICKAMGVEPEEYLKGLEGNV